MYTIARLYPSAAQAQAAATAFVAAGYRQSDVLCLLSEQPLSQQPPAEESPSEQPSSQESLSTEARSTQQAAPAGTAEGAEPPSPAPAAFDLETAVAVGKMLGEQADFYLSRLTRGRALLVATPHFMQSRAAERILDAHDPLPDSHRPPPKPFVPASEQATPFSNWLGMPLLSKSDTPLSDFCGFGFKEEGLSQLSRKFKPLAADFTLFSGRLGFGSKASRDTIFPMSAKSDRLEGRHASFGMGFKSTSNTPFSSRFGFPLLTQRKHFLSR